ncbi:hypothetical protein CMI45_00375 [Candidatus Pacearchaeota archaeon]|nr:hypothetical protein [Candidatus Pacearchaeota archaeon]|tara:strand:+ start:3419 stop:3868 length:450 start_codon:yes stop_codon:yes gene_type:complete
MKIQFIKSAEKKKLVSQLNEQFGITNIPYLLLESGKEKVRAFSGSLSKDEIMNLRSFLNIETMGLYFIKKETPIRLSFDAPHLLKDQITKNIIPISEEQLNDWLHGSDLQVVKPSGSYIISLNNDFVGLGKSNSSVILNHVPKDRRLKN